MQEEVENRKWERKEGQCEGDGKMLGNGEAEEETEEKNEKMIKNCL